MRFCSLLAVCFTPFFYITAASAQTQIGSNGPVPSTASSDPAALPGDFMDIPQSAQLHVPLGPAAGPRPPSSKHDPDAPPTLSFALALEAANAAVASCQADGYTVAVAVTDAAGNLKVALAPDGARSNGVFMAVRKDVTVTQFGVSTLALRQRISRDPSLMARVKPNMSLLPGGTPIISHDHLFGAISASGASAYQEEKCANAGIRKIQIRLR